MTDPFQRLARAALSRWPFEVLRVEPIKVRENAVYAVHTANRGRVVARVHRLGYHSNEALESESWWMAALTAEGIEVPRVVPSSSGRAFELVDFPEVPGPRQVDVFEWIEGRQLGSVEHGVSAAPGGLQQIYRAVGELAARMHNQSCRWQRPPGFHRHAWDIEGLAGENPLWGRFWELEALSPAQRSLFEHIRWRVARDLAVYGLAPDRYGLIHADLVPENVLVDGDRLRVIDFDDAGYGWHLFEIATSVYFIRRESFYETALDALITGYRMHRPLAQDHLRWLPMFLAARGTTYLGWIHTRKGEPAAGELTSQTIELAVAAAEDYLAGSVG